MKRITLTMFFAFAVTAGTARAQDPVPPAARTPRPDRLPLPAIAPLAPGAPLRGFDLPDFESARAAREAARADMQAMRDVEGTRPAIAGFDRDFAPIASARWLNPGAMRDFTDRPAPEPWAQGDPADSLYRAARDALNRGDYGRAARAFAEIGQKYPRSAYGGAESAYYEALARYKIGTTDELKDAAKALEPFVGRDGGTVASDWRIRRGASDADVASLYARINGVLAQRGDKDAADKVAKAAAQAGKQPCDQEEVQVQVEALNALTQMDPASAMPVLRRVLDRKDECSVSLRRDAVFMLGRRADTTSAALLISVAKSDPSVDVRTRAIDFLPRLPGDIGVNAAEELLRTDTDERIQRAAVRALMQSDNPKAHASMRALIDRKDASLNLRVEAINSLLGDRATADDAAYLRNFYAKADNDRLKAAVIGTVARLGGAENDQWVMSIAKNPNESSQLRSIALSRFARSGSVSVSELGKLYDSAESQNMRSQIIDILANRREPEATDKLIDIVKNGTDYRMRLQAINAITRKNDPRATKLMMDIIDKNPSDVGEKKP